MDSKITLNTADGKVVSIVKDGVGFPLKKPLEFGELHKEIIEPLDRLDKIIDFSGIRRVDKENAPRTEWTLSELKDFIAVSEEKQIAVLRILLEKNRTTTAEIIKRSRFPLTAKSLSATMSGFERRANRLWKEKLFHRKGGTYLFESKYSNLLKAALDELFAPH